MFLCWFQCCWQLGLQQQQHSCLRQVEPVNDEECRVRVECWGIAWPHLKFDLHLLGHAPDNSDVVLTLLLENEQLRRNVDALSAKFAGLQAKLEQFEQQQQLQREAGGKGRGDSSERDELDQFLLGQSGRDWAARQVELVREQVGWLVSKWGCMGGGEGGRGMGREGGRVGVCVSGGPPGIVGKRGRSQLATPMPR